NEQVLNGTPEQAVEGLRRYQEWRDRRAERIAAAGLPRFRIATAETFGRVEEAEWIDVQTFTQPIEQGRPTGRRFGRLVHDILQHAASPGEAETLAAIWG